MSLLDCIMECFVMLEMIRFLPLVDFTTNVFKKYLKYFEAFKCLLLCFVIIL